MRFAIIGGDDRYKYLKRLLETDGHETAAYCCKFTDDCADSIDDAVRGCHAVLGPIPCTRGKRTLALNECSEIELSVFFEKIPKESLFFAGVVTDEVKAAANGIKVYDYFTLPEVAIRNAIPTAEGAIQNAISESDRTLFGSRVLIIGCGRCAKALALMLRGMGAKVTLTQRRPEDEAVIQGHCLESMHIDELKNRLHEYDFVFNTAPAPILDRKMLEYADKNTLITDIAQAPGGTDFNRAAELGIKAFYCPGLPGRTAPLTAAEILKEAIIRLTREHFGI